MDLMMVWLGIKKCVNYFKLRHDICICIFVCMTKYNQISCNSTCASERCKTVAMVLLI